MGRSALKYSKLFLLSLSAQVLEYRDISPDRKRATTRAVTVSLYLTLDNIPVAQFGRFANSWSRVLVVLEWSRVDNLLEE